MKSYWEEAAAAIEEIYGGVVDYNERFFVCPECGEPIYEDDWLTCAFICCPICGFEFVDEENEEEDE